MPTVNDVEAHWGIAYHSNSYSPRAVKWYHITRLVHVDGKWFKLYWHPDIKLRGKNHKEIRERALDNGLHLLHGVFSDAPPPRYGSEMQWSIEGNWEVQMKYNDDQAKREGWAIFECDDGMLRIQRLDCPSDAFADLPNAPIFPSDSAAIAHVERQMARGSKMHTAALALHNTKI